MSPLQSAFMALVFASLSTEAHAEVSDKIPSMAALWGGLALLLVVSFILGSWRAPAALAIYPFSLIFSALILDIIWSDIGTAVEQENGWPYIGSAYATTTLAILGPAIAWATLRKRLQISN